MDPRTPWPLVWGSLFALPAAVLARCCLPAAAALAAFGVLVALRSTHRCRWAGLCALPAMLAALEVPEPAREWPRAGPVRVAGRVTDVQRAPQTGETTVRLGSGRRAVRLHLAGPVRVLPGDRLAATACLSPTIAPGLVPALHAVSGAVRIHSGPPSVPRAAAAARRALEQELLRLVPGESGALLATLALGRGTAPAADLTEAHQACARKAAKGQLRIRAKAQLAAADQMAAAIQRDIARHAAERHDPAQQWSHPRTDGQR